MRVCGIITEYNPFHNGHRYQIDEVKKAGYNYIIAVMSGDFTQRGEPAVIDKYSRARMALNNGVDLVLELPVAYATSDARGFATGGVSLLNSLGVVDTLAFGVEKGCEDICTRVASFLASAPDIYEKDLESKLRDGLSYPVARSATLKQYMPDLDPNSLTGSNTILAIEYCHALNRLHSSIQPFPIARLGSDYNEKSINPNGYSSASAIRDLIASGNTNPELLKSHMPDNCVSVIKASQLILPADISSLLHYKLLTLESYSEYLNVSESFSDRILSLRNQYKGYEDFCALVKSKNITLTSVKRLLAHILLDIRANDVPVNVPYARILGFNKNASELLSAIKCNSSIPMISKMADSEQKISGSAIDILNIDIKAANIYESIITSKYNIKNPSEFTHGLVIVP